MSTSKSLARRRANLMRTNPYCHWCGRKLIYFKVEKLKEMPPNFATIDHIYSRLLHPQGRPQPGERVLACPECNQARNIKEHKSLPREELWRRSGAYPRTIDRSSPLLLCSPTERVNI